jgi:hypothetical protein
MTVTAARDQRGHQRSGDDQRDQRDHDRGAGEDNAVRTSRPRPIDSATEMRRAARDAG